MSDSPHERPPEELRRTMERRLPAEERELILHELDDLYALRVERDGREAATAWYRAQTLKTPARLRAHDAGRAFRSAVHPNTWRGMMTLDSMGRDLRYALRRVLRAPGFTAIAVLSLSLGIGANTAMFSIVNAVLLADPPFAQAEELADVYTSDSGGTLYGTWSYPDYQDLRERSEGVFEEVSAARTFVAVGGDDLDAEVVIGEAVTPNHFSMQGIPMAVGRSFGEGEWGPNGTSPVAVLNHGTWVREFGADPTVVGRSWRINQMEYEIVGVAPEWYTGSFPAFHSAVFVPMNMIEHVMGQVGDDPLVVRGNRSSFVRARLAEGMSVEQANAWLQSFGAALSEEHPGTNDGRIYTAVALDDILIHPMLDRFLLPVAGFLMALVGIVLLIACVNLAGFLLARAEQRRREIAVRLSLGAGRASLVRQLLVETVLLGALGGVGGVLIARWAVDLLVSVRPPIPVPINLDFPLDGSVLLFTLAVSLGAGVFFGLIPALQATKPEIAGTLRQEGGGATRTSRARSALVVAQMSLSVMLLVGSALFVRSLLEAQRADPGFHTGEAAIVWPHLGLSGMSDEEGAAWWDELEERLAATPGISHVGFIDMFPLGFGVQTRAVEIPGMTSNARQDGRFEIDFANASPGYFSTLDIPIERGRGFNRADAESGTGAILVSRAFEERFFPDGAVGRTIDAGRTAAGLGGDPTGSTTASSTIVGVVADTKVRTIGEDPRPRIYFPFGEAYLESAQIVTRGSGDSGEILRRTVEVIEELNPGTVLFDQRTMEEQLAVHLFPPRAAALLLLVFGGLALLLAAVGIWGVVSHAVAQRTREVGIRVSMGATGGQVIGLLVGSGMRVVAVGIVVGLALAAGAGVLVSGFLYGVSPLDVPSFVGIPLLLGGVAFLAAWLPARRAAGVDPVRALRSE